MSTIDKSFMASKVISEDGPNTDQQNHERLLEEWCATRVEPLEETNRRRQVLERLTDIMHAWIRNTMITEFRMSEKAASQIEGRLFATGSFRYNVHTSGTDIDLVLIAPNRMTREHFFNTLAPRLKSEPWVTELHCITEARVPIIAMVCDGVDIDLSFGAIRQDRVPEVISDDLLQGLNEDYVRSCNAVRVAHSIMELVPQKSTFRQTLRFVKAWGKERAIYSNTFGFPSGIGWAILCAYVCQIFPNQNAAGTVTKFFRTYAQWFKPTAQETNAPIYLTAEASPQTSLGRCWNPRTSRADAAALFPVLTPALPYSNACYNVTLTNLMQLCDEFRRGHEICSEFMSLDPAEAQRRFGPYGVWSHLLQRADFFGKYPHYLHVQVSCSDAQHYPAYADAVESRIRTLWAGNASTRGHNLEDIPGLRLHLNPRRFEDPTEVESRAAAAAQAKKGPASGRNSATVHSGRASATLGGPSSAAAAAGAAGPQWHTAHYFIGMTATGEVKIALQPAVQTFHSVVRGLSQFRPDCTRLPVVTPVTMETVPDFVKQAVGYVPPAPTVETPAAADAPAVPAEPTTPPPSSASATGAATHAPPSTAAAASQPPSALAGHASDLKRGRDDVAADGAPLATRRRTEATSAGVSGAPRRNAPPIAKADDTNNDDDDLETALGLDF